MSLNQLQDFRRWRRGPAWDVIDGAVVGLGLVLVLLEAGVLALQHSAMVYLVCLCLAYVWSVACGLVGSVGLIVATSPRRRRFALGLVIAAVVLAIARSTILSG